MDRQVVGVGSGFAQSLRSFAPPSVTASKAYRDETSSLFVYWCALPVISNQKMNDYLKDLCELCEFNTPITRVTYRAGKREKSTKP